jgi:hypothetical protein
MVLLCLNLSSAPDSAHNQTTSDLTDSLPCQMRHEAGMHRAQLSLIVHSEALAPGRPVPAARPNTTQPTESRVGTVIHQ